MNSRQRRGVILLVLSVLCALVAFAGVLSLINEVDSKVGPEVTAYELKLDVRANQALSADDLTEVSMPKRWLPSTAVTDVSQISGKTAATRLTSGSLLQTDMVSDQPELKPGQQELAIMIDAETGVAGKINPGATVNIFATFQSSQQGRPDESRIIVTGAHVLDVGKLTPISHTGDQANTNRTTEAVPITFALDAEDAQRVTYAESFATHVRLALVAPGGDTAIPSGQQTYTLEGDK